MLAERTRDLDSSEPCETSQKLVGNERNVVGVVGGGDLLVEVNKAEFADEIIDITDRDTVHYICTNRTRKSKQKLWAEYTFNKS